ncbi:twin-arginine translocase subunit TatC [Priestia endophytica]|jgi:sec-independent protein translocase protein TatC|uniref:Sec-independent protein translocase protein TatC n=1 Tax=Priestia endophytica TaxID=135735 RepID=A0AAX1QA91_9BACI|nr:twin-arginine translocase subunit TatC [Priestia endophytica]RAS78740.1 twin-arginine translocase subunit TatC [Priestia endophytica]RAS78922.1 twin-arginine translocase subunit TatC [Priestia endophytica]RAS85397.1 twin-arginine translocase subunit TatC [Priestia endophytica]RAS89354.1 twin-arginine translocase subunit TatC [Priestia endophytica]
MENDHGELIGHLNELRQRIIKILFTFIIFLVTAFIFVEDMYNWLVRDLDGKLAILGPGDILWVYMIISTICAIAFTIPVAAYQVWRFVKPALTREESMVTLSFIPGIFVLFITGISFGYFVLFPTVLGFLTNLSVGQFETMFTAEEYFRFMLHLSLPFGFLFEMPLVVMFLTRLGILNPMRLAKARKLSYFTLIVVSVLITPPDFISDILVIVPLLLLYELSITISKFVYKKRIESDVSI